MTVPTAEYLTNQEYAYPVLLKVSGPRFYPINFGGEFLDAIEAATQARRDAQLGRVRSKVHPQHVIYPRHDDGMQVLVWDEVTAKSYLFDRDTDAVIMSMRPLLESAREYFETHPLPDPEWWDAQPGEVWLVAIENRHALPYYVSNRRAAEFNTFERAADNALSYVGVRAPAITSAHRIYPEES